MPKRVLCTRGETIRLCIPRSEHVYNSSILPVLYHMNVGQPGYEPTASHGRLDSLEPPTFGGIRSR